MIPSRDDILRTLYTLVSEEQMRLRAKWAGFPHERLPGRGASLTEIATVVVDTAAPEVWTKLVNGLAADMPNRAACTNYLRTWAPGSPPRTLFAAVAPDTSGVWAIGDTIAEARAGALDRRAHLRDEAQALDLTFPDASTDAAWLGGFAIVTLSGTTEALRALIKSMETGDSVAPWCPADLWDSGEVKP